MALPEDLARVQGRMERYEQAMLGRTEAAEAELLRIFRDAEKALVAQRAELLSGLRAENEILINDPQNLARIDGLIDQVRAILREELVGPGRQWADSVIPRAFRDGRELARINLSLIPENIVKEAFRQVTDAEAGVLQVGLKDTYRIVGTVGDDIGEFFRQELTESVILGRPVVGPGSLAERLFESGRLKSIQIRTKDGKLVTRSVEQRAVAIARVETAKVVNRAHEVKANEVFGAGGELKYANINPEDSRTTDICLEASQQEPMTLKEWDASEWGRPPRLRPQFHLCRSLLIAVPP